MALPNVQITANIVAAMGNFKTVEALTINVGIVAAIGAATTAEITFTGLQTGLIAGDVIVGVSKPTAQAGLGIAGYRVSPTSPDTFYVTYINATAAAITPTASEIYTITIGRYSVSNSGFTAVV